MNPIKSLVLKALHESFLKKLETDYTIHGVARERDKIIIYVEDLHEALKKYGKPYGAEYRETKKFKAYLDNTMRHRPFSAGHSIGHYKITAGTAGAKVFNNETGKFAVLSNNHVLANTNSGRVGDQILQPGPYDFGEKDTDKVAELTKFVPLRDHETVDAAIADLVKDDIMTDLVVAIGEIYGIALPYRNQFVYKYGRTSDRTRGVVTSTSASFRVWYSETKSFILDDVIVVDLESSPGDSGSPVLDFSNNYIIGLLFAGSDKETLVCKATNIFNKLPISLPTHETITRTMWIDISKWQGRIDFNVMKSRGVEGVIMKICEGKDYVDPNFETNYSNARAAGMLVGGYIFVDPSYSYLEHLENLKRSVGTKKFDLPFALDCEKHSNKEPRYVTSLIQNLAREVSAWEGRNCIIYTAPYFWNTYVLRWEGWKNYPLWIARWSNTLYDPFYGLQIPDWDKWHIWQHNVLKDSGSWFGVESSSVDVNTTNEYFRELLSEPQPPVPGELRAEFSANKTTGVAPLEVRFENQSVGNITEYRWGFGTGDTSNEVNPIYVYQNPGEYTVTLTVVGEDLREDTKVKDGYIEVTMEQQKTEFITYKGKTRVNLNIRSGIGTKSTKIGVIPVNTIVDILEEGKDEFGNTWARIGYNQWAAMVYNSNKYIEYI